MWGSNSNSLGRGIPKTCDHHLKTPSHSQAEELKVDPFRVGVDQNNYLGCSSCIGAAMTAAQNMHV